MAETPGSFFRDIQLSDVRLRVHSLQEMLAFYRDTLGLRVVSAQEDRAELSADGQLPALIILEQDPAAPPRPRGSAGLFHVAFLFPTREALGSALVQLATLKYPLQGASDHGVSEALYLADPEGNGIELYADRPSADWPKNGEFVAMGSEPLAIQELFDLGQRTGSEYHMPTETRIGHIHLSVTELGAPEKIFREDLGMAIRQQSYPGALFFGYDGYHHHLAANTWSTRRSPEPGSLGMESFTLRLRADHRPVTPGPLEVDGIAFQLISKE